MLKIDLHTHSSASPDGGITADQYRSLVDSDRFAQIAITDHNRVDLALALRKELGNVIIVGEEIMTTGGEIVGLFLKKLVEPQQSPLATVLAIKKQGGLVYIPHPFEHIRHGLSVATLDSVAKHVDIVEVRNGRRLRQNHGDQAVIWAQRHHKPQAASSDAHGLRGVGFTYTSVAEPLTPENFAKILVKGKVVFAWPPLRSLLYPKLNRLRKIFVRGGDK